MDNIKTAVTQNNQIWLCIPERNETVSAFRPIDKAVRRNCLSSPLPRCQVCDVGMHNFPLLYLQQCISMHVLQHAKGERWRFQAHHKFSFMPYFDFFCQTMPAFRRKLSFSSLGYIQSLAIFQQHIKWIVQYEHRRWINWDCALHCSFCLSLFVPCLWDIAVP